MSCARSAPVPLPTAQRVLSENPRPDLRRLRRAPGRGGLCLCLQFEALVRVCLFDCLFLCVSLSFFGWLVGWLAVCGHMVFLLCLAPWGTFWCVFFAIWVGFLCVFYICGDLELQCCTGGSISSLLDYMLLICWTFGTLGA